MKEYFIYVEWDDTDISNCLIISSTFDEAKTWMLENYKKGVEMRLIEGESIHFKYHEEIKTGE